MIRWLRRILVIASVLGWVMSLWRVGLVSEGRAISGFYVLLWGWIGPLGGQLAWYANPLYFLAVYWMAIYKPNHARVVALVALGVASLPLATTTLNASFPFAPIQYFGPGYPLWLGSMALFFATALLLPRRWPYDRAARPATPHRVSKQKQEQR